jgi:hypothetical protein
MPKKSKPPREDPEAKEQLRADRDDALGYSREQFTFEKPKNSKAKKKPKAKSRKTK